MPAEVADSGPEIQYVDVHCLVDLTEEQQASYVREIQTGDDNVDFIAPHFVPWTDKRRDGNMDDLYRIYNEKKEGTYSFFFFIDQQCLSDTSMIIAQVDEYTMMFSQEASEVFNGYLEKYPIEGLDEVHGGHMELVIDEAAERGLTFGRVPASEFRSIWANLDISNMQMSELVEYCGGKTIEGLGKVEMIENPKWDPEAFMLKLGEASKPEAKL